MHYVTVGYCKMTYASLDDLKNKVSGIILETLSINSSPTRIESVNTTRNIYSSHLSVWCRFSATAITDSVKVHFPIVCGHSTNLFLSKHKHFRLRKLPKVMLPKV